MFSTVKTMSDIVDIGRWDARSIIGQSSASEPLSEGSCRLGELVQEMRISADPPTSPDQTFRYIGLENVESVSGDLVGTIVKCGGQVKSRSKCFQAGDVLYGRLRPALAKAFWCPPGFEDGFCSGEFIVLRPNSAQLSGRVVRELLASPKVAQLMGQKVAGAALPRVSAADLLQLAVPNIAIADYSSIAERLLVGDGLRKDAKAFLATQPGEFQALVWGGRA